MDFLFPNSYRSLLRLNTIALCLIAAAGCSTYSNISNPLYGRLKDRGPVIVSSDNPYVAANMLIDKEMESSDEIKGFVQKRGAPAAIEVTQGLLSSPKMIFYYPENAEYYSLENDKNFWVIDGPKTLEGEKLEKVLQMTQVRSSQGIQFKSQLGQGSSAEASSSGPLSDEVKPTLRAGEAHHQKALTESETKHKEKSDKKSSKTSTSLEKSSKTLTEKNTQAPSGKDEAIVRENTSGGSQTQGELTPKGDLVHYVTMHGETLSLISRWYTYDSKNAGKIARVSGLQPGAQLGVGDTVIIPAYLLKNRARMTSKGMSALLRESKTPEKQ